MRQLSAVRCAGDRDAAPSGEATASSRRGVASWLAISTVLGRATPVAADAKDDEVVEVVDGDTLKLAVAGRCRLIGVNTPETVAPRQRTGGEPPDCFGPEASAFTKQMFPKGTKVRIELDAEPLDKYGRTLAYVYRSSDGLFLNSELLKQGLARRYRVAPNVRYDAAFVQTEKDAAAAGKGLWKACKAPAKAGTSGPTAAAAKSAAAKPTGPAAASGNPGDTKNCNDFPTYDEAKAWFDAYFPLYGDVAKLDGDGDGKPCEGLLRKKA